MASHTQGDRQLETGIRLIKEAFAKQMANMASEVSRLTAELARKTKRIQDLETQVAALTKESHGKDAQLAQMTESLTRYEDLKNVIMHTMDHVGETEQLGSIQTPDHEVMS
ncbi:hypothetical protein H4R34_000909 [Dimargaris verticillata]|uniref:Uncharacterized protein n=1 Tax=Dimargaris verticillata TaxID=2761393 RepID=A0A9W8EEZ1_9FUNG|nr:hypothetical protein H4R34_000909 [Dimargaris verticillata]